MSKDTVVDENFIFTKQPDGSWLCRNNVDGIQFGFVQFHRDLNWYFYHPFDKTAYSSSALVSIEKFMNYLRMVDMETVK